MKTKEISFTLPFMIIFCEFTFLKGDIKRKILYITPFVPTLFIIPFSIFGPELFEREMIGDFITVKQIKDLTTLSPYVYLITQFRVIVTYLRLLILPVGQNLDYDYPLFYSPFDLQVFLSIIFLSGIFLSAIYILKRSIIKGDGRRFFISFGILWFFITISVESSIIPIDDVIFEHRVYLPGIGMFMAFSIIIVNILERYKSDRFSIYYIVLVFTIILPLCIATWKRNLIWLDDITLWKDVVSKSPNKARGYNHLGIAYVDKGMFDKAIDVYTKAISIKPDYAVARNNLGLVYVRQERFKEAIKEYKMALNINPGLINVYYNLGYAYELYGDMDMAIKVYRDGLRLKSNYILIRKRLANLYFYLNLIDNAIKEYREILSIEPNNIMAYNNLGLAYAKKGLFKEAIEQYSIALRLNPYIAEVYNNLGNVYYRTGQMERAVEMYKKALNIKPTFKDALENLNLAQEKTR